MCRRGNRKRAMRRRKKRMKNDNRMSTYREWEKMRNTKGKMRNREN